MNDEKQLDYVHQAGVRLFVALQALPAEADAGQRARLVGKALGEVGLGLTLTTNLREVVLKGYEEAGDCRLFVNGWRRSVLNEKNRWFEFRLGVRPVLAGVN